MRFIQHSEGKSVAAERFTGMLKNKIYNYMSSASKNMSIHKRLEM